MDYWSARFELTTTSPCTGALFFLRLTATGMQPRLKDIRGLRTPRSSRRPPKLLYDTTVYIGILQGRFPEQGEAMVRATEAWHSPVYRRRTRGDLRSARSRALPNAPDHRASCRGHRAAAQLPDAYARFRDLAGSRSAVGHAGPDPGIWNGAAAARSERRVAICHRSRIWMCAIVPAMFETSTCCS